MIAPFVTPFCGVIRLSHFVIIADRRRPGQSGLANAFGERLGCGAPALLGLAPLEIFTQRQG
jgi:2-iminobutanoate/2-iminopropanoate deaminase